TALASGQAAPAPVHAPEPKPLTAEKSKEEAASHQHPHAEAPHRPVAVDSIRIPTQKLDDVLNTASEVFISRIRLAGDVADLSTKVRQLKQALQRMDEIS